MERFINGIQQIGIGVPDAKVAFEWYKKIFGTDIIVFKDTAVASLMKQYTGNIAQKRNAILAMNMEGGGGGLEIWQYINKIPVAPTFEIALGDTGIFAVKIRCKTIEATYDFYKTEKVNIINTPARDWEGLAGSKKKCRRVILKKFWKPTGAFGKLLGPVQIELVQAINHQPKKIFANRHCGDLGFIHVCFDLNNMKAHEEICAVNNYPLTVNSANSFNMGEVGHFAYNEDQNGTLIEYVETHKVPVAQKFGLYLNIKNRNPKICLPNWVVKCLRFSRVK